MKIIKKNSLYFTILVSNLAKAREKFYGVYDHDVLSNAAPCRMFAYFNSGNCDFKVASYPGRPMIGKVNETVPKINENLHIDKLRNKISVIMQC